MGFWDIFWPVTSAFMVVSIIRDAAHFGLGVWEARRQQMQYEEYVKNMLAQGMPPEMLNAQMMGGQMQPQNFPGRSGLVGEDTPTTTSGSEGNRGHGQYL